MTVHLMADHEQFSESIRKKVHPGLWKKSKGRALAILKRAEPCSGFELTPSERFELEQIAKTKKS